MTMIEINVPFSGFYGSHHEDEIDRAINNALCTDYSCDEADPAMADVFWGNRSGGLWSDRRPNVDYSAVHEHYGRYYVVEYICEHLHIPYAPGYAHSTPATGCVSSPHEYNFATDRLFVEVEARYMIDALCRIVWDDDALEAFKFAIRERFTPRSGFMPHYPNDLADWPDDLGEWDHNHWGTVVAVYAKHFGGWGGESYSAAHSLMEDALCNGFVSDLVDRYANEDAQRLFTLAYNLGQRREREATRPPHTGLEAGRGMIDAGAA